MQHDQGTGERNSEEVPRAALLRLGAGLGADLDLEALMLRILEAARELTGARYAALGVLDARRERIARLVTSGIDESSRRAIGEPPRGRGVLGMLIAEPRALRLSNVGGHPLSCGLPQGHPPITSFLGAPIMLDGVPWANLYLAEKQGAAGAGGAGAGAGGAGAADADAADTGAAGAAGAGAAAGIAEFTAVDEAAVVTLAAWSSSAVGNARRHEASERRRAQLERVAQGWEATREIAAAITDSAGLERVLELIAKRWRALLDARCVLLMLRHDSELVLEASAGHMCDPGRRRLPVSGSLAGQALQSRRPLRMASLDDDLAATVSEFGVRDAEGCLIVPMLHRGCEVGALCAFDGQAPPHADTHAQAGAGWHAPAPFGDADELLLDSFAASAASAVAIARIIDAGRRHG